MPCAAHESASQFQGFQLSQFQGFQPLGLSTYRPTVVALSLSLRGKWRCCHLPSSQSKGITINLRTEVKLE